MIMTRGEKVDTLIIGCGFAGGVVARVLAERGEKVKIIEKRNHIGGNCYDDDEYGVLVHKYGPHIFHTNNKEVFDFYQDLRNGMIISTKLLVMFMVRLFLYHLI